MQIALNYVYLYKFRQFQCWILCKKQLAQPLFNNLHLVEYGLQKCNLYRTKSCAKSNLKTVMNKDNTQILTSLPEVQMPMPVFAEGSHSAQQPHPYKAAWKHMQMGVIQLPPRRKKIRPLQLELGHICDQMHECIHWERYIKTVHIMKDQRMK